MASNRFRLSHQVLGMRAAIDRDTAMTELFELNPQQLDELRACAVRMVESDNLEKLSWEDAWSGIYPQEPTEEQIEAELKALMEKAVRILSGNYDFAQEHEYLRDRIRILELESCKTFDIWINEPEAMDQASFDTWLKTLS